MELSPEITIKLAGESVALLPDPALYWRDTLYVTDPHWGKAAAFRAASVAIPGETTGTDLERLSQAIQRTGARRLVLLGDLFHARQGVVEHVLAAVRNWREQHADLAVLLVRGNHDHRAGDPPVEWRFQCVDEPYIEAPFVLQHHPDPSDTGYVLAGHVHPAVVLSGKGRTRAKLPCFLFGERVGILPAFGSFTGTAVVIPQHTDRVYVIVDGTVVSVQ
jgi:uncharacterized protein